ncbi:MAG: hypothetical protein WBL63_00065 [Candidatus Acidiferrum sp.]
MIEVWLFFALAFASPQQGGPAQDEQAAMQERARLENERHRQAAIQMNDLAGRIHSEEDALAFVDAVAAIFSNELPPAWAGPAIRHRVAHAEYETVSDPSRLISEQRIVDVWNEYVRQIGAADEALVNAAEIHSMRDATYAFGQMLWTQGRNQSFWTMPNTYSIGPDGKIAGGCRAVEALRVFSDLDMRFGNLRGARERLRKGVVVSDELAKRPENPHPNQKGTIRIGSHLDDNPLPSAEYSYMRDHGVVNFDQLLERLFAELFPAVE